MTRSQETSRYFMFQDQFVVMGCGIVTLPVKDFFTQYGCHKSGNVTDDCLLPSPKSTPFFLNIGIITVTS